MLLGVFIGHAVAANATQQIPDEIVMEDGGLRALLAEPLAAAPDYADVRARLSAYIDPGRCTASTRGYVAQWMIFRDEMQLARIVANPCSRRNAVPLDALWPDRALPVRATWFSGELVARKTGSLLEARRGLR